jgi:uncharacterized protein with PIN domain/exonuclease III
MKLKIANWNILADCYSHSQSKSLIIDGEKYTSTAEEAPTSVSVSASSWRYRSSLITTLLSHLSELSTDVICLQEVDHYEDFYHSLFERLGFTSIYLQRPGGKKDGCLIAFRKDRFSLLDQEEVDLDRLSYLDSHERSFNGIGFSGNGRSKFAKQNVALFLLLETNNTEESEAKEKKEKKRFIVGTCHVHWNPNLSDVKFAQTLLILEELKEFRDKHHQAKCTSKNEDCPVILTGDFNSFPTYELYALITGNYDFLKSRFASLYFSMLLKKGSTASVSSAIQSLSSSHDFYYGPNTKFLCDFSLSRLCRWMRILGIDIAMDSWENKIGHSSNPPAYTTAACLLRDDAPVTAVVGGGGALTSSSKKKGKKQRSAVSSTDTNEEGKPEVVVEETNSDESNRTSVTIGEVTSSDPFGTLLSEAPSLQPTPESSQKLLTSFSSSNPPSDRYRATPLSFQPSDNSKKHSIASFFERAKKEKRVILTSSKTLIERNTCPKSFYIHPGRLEYSLCLLYKQFGLDLNRERFLTVCGKCGGEIEELEVYDGRFIGKIIPTDRQIYACKLCAQVRTSLIISFRV